MNKTTLASTFREMADDLEYYETHFNSYKEILFNRFDESHHQITVDEMLLAHDLQEIDKIWELILRCIGDPVDYAPPEMEIFLN